MVKALTMPVSRPIQKPTPRPARMLRVRQAANAPTRSAASDVSASQRDKIAEQDARLQNRVANGN